MADPARSTEVAPSGTLAEYARQFTSRLTQHKTRYGETDSSALLFGLCGETFALPATAVLEVILPPRIHRVPRCLNPRIAGLANFRGELAVCASLEKLLSLRGSQTAGAAARLIILSWQSSMLGFMADEVFGVVRFQRENLGRAPASVDPGGLVLGVLEANGKAASVLSVDAIFASLHQTPAARKELQ